MPWPYEGRTGLVSVDLDLAALKSKNLARMDVVNASCAEPDLPQRNSEKSGHRICRRIEYSPKQWVN